MRVLLTGDLVLDAEPADHWLSGIAAMIDSADVAIGHLEVPHTDSQDTLKGDVPAPGAPPAHVDAIAKAGFDAVSLAGNHIADCGAQGIADTLANLGANNICHTGAGENISSARRPALLDRDGQQIGLLSYNCVGPEAAWAATDRAGCAYLPMVTKNGEPVAPTNSIVGVEDEAREILKQDIEALRNAGAHVIIVALHKGTVHTPVSIEPYERAVSHLAIDMGADVVVGHHAHILRGIEIHDGKPIFHGLGNGCVVTRALSPGQDDPDRAAWVERRKALFGFEPDPAYELAPFHPEAVNAMVAVVDCDETGLVRFGFKPVFVEPPGRPVVPDAAQFDKIVDYVEDITKRAGLPPLKLDIGPEMVEVLK